MFSPPRPLNTAVLFLVFNRPDTTAQVFEAIRRAKPPRLYVAADGAHAGRANESQIVGKVREIATNVDWPCEVSTLFRDKNLGCKNAISSAISWFFTHEAEGIIIEDDCLPSQSFFWFCEEMLERFRHDQGVMAVTGTNITRHIAFEADYFYSRYALMWGWATWASAWKQYDLQLKNWPGVNQIKHLKGLGVTRLKDALVWKSVLTQVKDGGIDTWDFQWIYSCWMCGGLSIAPAKNLIRNNGFSSDATHTTNFDPIRSTLVLNDLHWPLEEPLERMPHVEADNFIGKYWFGASWKSLLELFLLRLLTPAYLSKLTHGLLSGWYWMDRSKC